MQIGIVGLPFSGKTTLFQTLTETHFDSSASQKKDSSLAMVKVPDNRLDILTGIFNPKKKVNAVIEIVDIAGIQKGDRSSSQFSSQFLGKVKTNDALLHVVRAFQDDSVPHIDGSIDLMRDIRTLEEEFLLTDMAFLESRFEKLEKEMQKQKNKDEVKKELEIMHKWNDTLQNEIPLREIEITGEEIKYQKNYQPLTSKPLIIAVNMSENDVRNADKIISEIKTQIKGTRIAIEPFFAKIEMELSQLEPEEKQVFMEEYGLKDSPLSRMIRSAYDLLGLRSFFTVGEDECRAWTIKSGMNAQEAAGAIHTDFYNKFIRAEVVGYQDFIDCGSLSKCKEKGLFRLEGKEYIVADGDILNIRHG